MFIAPSRSVAWKRPLAPSVATDWTLEKLSGN